MPFYDSIYRTYSDIAHWSARSLFLNVNFDQGAPTGYNFFDKHSAANSLKVGHFSAHQTFRFLSWKFSLGLEDDLNFLHDQFELEANKEPSGQ